ncbi:MAG: hypothetical protein EBQ51_04060 [Verrucomicrobia bacterium]|nr:hypothetical protein [Pseudomonadota bacterium]NBS07749.1 hypothetical protein [Verrucomicrobiota bacterium]NBS78316.1 hypothetical protein [bacterium]NBS50937.1 hypothetical protein [Verrucomicrobiota bacterium]NBT23110.1 hypothetical protein [bacterium]
MHLRHIVLFILGIGCISEIGFAQIQVVNFGSGSSATDAWVNVNSANFSGYGGFPGSSAWPAPIGSNGIGSGDADLSRIAGSPTGGGPFLSSTSIYFGNFAQVPNALGGTLRVSDSTPLPNLKTLVFQVQIGEATGYDLFSAPALKINGGSSVVSPLFSGILNRFQSGTYPSPATGLDEPVYVNTRGYQWDVSSLAVTSLTIDFSGVTHSQIYGLQLDQSSSFFSTAVIPEPNVTGLVLAGVCFSLFRRRVRVVA